MQYDIRNAAVRRSKKWADKDGEHQTNADTYRMYAKQIIDEAEKKGFKVDSHEFEVVARDGRTTLKDMLINLAFGGEGGGIRASMNGLNSLITKKYKVTRETNN